MSTNEINEIDKFRETVEISDSVDEYDQKRKCAICFENIENENYGTIDHPSDSQTKCCHKCLKNWFETNNTS